jgi:hypothetical protein
MARPFQCRFAHNGIDEYRLIGDAPALRLQAGAAWTFLTEFQAIPGVTSRTIYSKQDAGIGLVIRHSSVAGSIEVTLAGSTGTASTRTTATTFADGATHKLAISYSGNSLTVGIVIVIDGVTQAKTDISDTYGGTLDASYPAAIGALHNAAAYSQFYSGRLGDVFFLSGAASAASMATFHASAQGTHPSVVCGLLSLFWASPAGTDGTTEPDLVGGSHATLTAMAGANLEDRLSFVNAVSSVFNGTDEHMVSTVAGAGVKELTDAWTCMAWIKTSTTGMAMAIVSKASNSTGWALRVNSTNQAAFYLLTAGGNFTRKEVTATGITGGSWYHLAATYNGSNTAAGIKLYGNGVELTTVLFSESNASGSILQGELAAIGCINPSVPDHLFNGNIDQVAVVPGVLSASQVAAIHASQAKKDLNTLVQPIDLYFRMGDGDTNTHVLDRSGNADDFSLVNMDSANYVVDVP